VIGISMALGPVLGGALVDSISWRAVFVVNVPVGIAAIVLTALFVPESRAARPRRPDPVGQVLVIVALATLTYAIIEGPTTGRMVGHRGPRPSLVIGGLGLMASSAILTQLTSTTPLSVLVVDYVVFGIGFGMVNPPITNTAVSGMPPSQAGVAAAVASTSRQVGISLGIAVIGAVAVARAGSPAALAAAGHPGWWIVAGCGALVLALGLASTSRPALA